MSVKTFTLAIIMYPTLSSLKITSPALIKNEQVGGKFRELGEAKSSDEILCFGAK